MLRRLPARLPPGSVVSRLIPVLAVGALLAACHDAGRSLAPRVNGPRLSLSSTAVLNGKIAFHSTRDGDFEIYVMNPDGSGVTRVTNTAGGNVDPIWSPDGKRIAFASFRSGRSEVFVINADGTGETQLTTEGGFPGAWSPDGTRATARAGRPTARGSCSRATATPASSMSSPCRRTEVESASSPQAISSTTIPFGRRTARGSPSTAPATGATKTSSS